MKCRRIKNYVGKHTFRQSKTIKAMIKLERLRSCLKRSELGEKNTRLVQGTSLRVAKASVLIRDYLLKHGAKHHIFYKGRRKCKLCRKQLYDTRVIALHCRYQHRFHEKCICRYYASQSRRVWLCPRCHKSALH